VQSAELALHNSEGAPFWLVNYSKTLPTVVSHSLWDHNARGVTGKKFIVRTDPFSKESPFDRLNQIPAVRRTIRLYAKHFYGGFVAAVVNRLLAAGFMKTNEELDEQVFGYEKMFAGAFRAFSLSTTKERRNFTKEFSLSLRALGKIKKSDYAEGVEELAKTGAALTAWGELDGPDTTGRAALDVLFRTVSSRRMQAVYDVKTHKLMSNYDVIPKRFLTLADLGGGSFTTYYSCNKSAFVRFINNLLITDVEAGAGVSDKTIRALTSRAAKFGKLKKKIGHFRSAKLRRAWRDKTIGRLIIRNDSEVFFRSLKWRAVRRKYGVSVANMLVQRAARLHYLLGAAPRLLGALKQKK